MSMRLYLTLLALLLPLTLAAATGCENTYFDSASPDSTLGALGGLTVEESLERYGDRSHIMILTQPPVDILAIAPDASRAGCDLESGDDLAEIANSKYFTEQIQGDYDWDYIEQSVLEIEHPAPGTYEIVLSSRLPGTSYLSVHACNAAGVPTDAVFLTEFEPGNGPKRFVLQYDRSSGGMSRIIPVTTAR